MNDETRHIYSVTAITRDIKSILENTFGGVWVEGEISNFKSASSGHFYFSLKDAQAVLGAAMFSRANKGIAFRIEDGLKVVCFGRIDVYAPRGQYQLIVERIEPQGIGARQLAFEQLKKKLFAQGLFDPARKKSLPVLPLRVGIVTSLHGAAVRDILQLLKKGAGFVDVVIRSVRVQGEHAAEEIAQAIDDFNQWAQVDLLIVSRGGGSVEDLWAFNEEPVAQALARSRLPVISAVGHQINTTLCDLVADVFVETPSAAAKMIVDLKHAHRARIDALRHELLFAVSERIGVLKHDLIALRHMLKSPRDKLREQQQYVDETAQHLWQSLRQCMALCAERLRSLDQKLDALSPRAVLARGYSVTMVLADGEVIKDTRRLATECEVKTLLAEGAFISTVKHIERNGGCQT